MSVPRLGGLALAFLVAASVMAPTPAEACACLLWLDPAEGTVLPSRPSVYISSTVAGDLHEVELVVESEGRAVAYRIEPTSVPTVRRVVVDLDEGPLLVRADRVVRTDSTRDVVPGKETRYRVSPDYRPAHVAEIVDVEFDRFAVLLGRRSRRLSVRLEGDAALYGLGAPDQGIPWDAFDGHGTWTWDRHPGPLQIIAFYSDGTERVLTWEPHDYRWLVATGLGVLLVAAAALWNRRRLRLVAV